MPADFHDAGFQQVLLQTWERLHAAAADARAVGLLQAVWPQPEADAWGAASLGTRDAALFRLQSALFGPQLHTLMQCPACGETLESQFDCAQFGGAEAPAPMPVPAALALREHDWEIEFRLPSSNDVVALREAAADPAVAVAALLRRCVLRVRQGEREASADELPAALVARLETRMAEHDPLADLRLALACPACATAWAAAFDIGGYLWESLDDWAQDLLSDVHQLARAYGWREHDILALTPLRRRFYLDMVQP
ncbi:hypothetical protein QSH18_08360 [Xanthomonas sp. NCPPB 2654]|uniref:hypothetical protein n=1 Tax=unclassified Xanthomonas TaxID=2643310 RepID=UPI0021E0E7DC|nr:MULTISPECIES: hypothetical protein [unclassified Xanthomonas]MDL5365614.1 hypothetical protein [Xanthomonas sp. NCPPB 2654]UYC18765.1 hypothetical protein NUG20_11140 [Xanthomonas sp. CFBP 8443]